MSTPGFAAEFSLYNSDRSYRLKLVSNSYLASQMTPQMKCEEYECGSPFWKDPVYCIRCEGDRPV
jgi:hypothetical protein